MRKFSIALILFVFLAGCQKMDVSPSVPDVTETPSASDPVMPANPTPPIDSDAEPSEEPPYPPPEVPSVDLTGDWTDNGLAVEKSIWENTYKSGGTTTLSASGSFPKTGEADIDEYYTRVRDGFESVCEALAEDARKDEKTYECTAEFTVECNAGGLLSVARSTHRYTGGAHGTTDVICETFAIQTGALLTLDDFFTVSRDEYTDRLLEYVGYAVDANPEGFYADAKLIAKEVFPYDTFVVTRDGISLLFPEYNLGPYAAGTIRVDVPWGAIHDIFKRP